MCQWMGTEAARLGVSSANKMRAAWEEHYPNWEWRNPELTEWQAEESDVSDEADKMEGDDDPS